MWTTTIFVKDSAYLGAGDNASECYDWRCDTQFLPRGSWVCGFLSDAGAYRDERSERTVRRPLNAAVTVPQAVLGDEPGHRLAWFTLVRDVCRAWADDMGDGSPREFGTVERRLLAYAQPQLEAGTWMGLRSDWSGWFVSGGEKVEVPAPTD